MVDGNIKVQHKIGVRFKAKERLVASKKKKSKCGESENHNQRLCLPPSAWGREGRTKENHNQRLCPPPLRLAVGITRSPLPLRLDAPLTRMLPLQHPDRSRVNCFYSPPAQFSSSSPFSMSDTMDWATQFNDNILLGLLQGSSLQVEILSNYLSVRPSVRHHFLFYPIFRL